MADKASLRSSKNTEHRTQGEALIEKKDKILHSLNRGNRRDACSKYREGLE